MARVSQAQAEGAPDISKYAGARNTLDLINILDLDSCCGEHCCYGLGYPSLRDRQPPPLLTTSTAHPFSHIHLFSRDDHTVHPLEIASVWIAILFSLLIIILVTRNLWRHFYTPPVLKRLRIYAEAPVYETSVSTNGSIIPSVKYFDSAEARKIIRRETRQKYSRQKGEETNRKQYEPPPESYKRRSHEARHRSLHMLEMEFELLRCDP